MSYEHDLSFNLRLRGMKEARIADAIEEVRVHSASSGETPESEFGTAEEYAATFPMVKKKSNCGAPA